MRSEAQLKAEKRIQALTHRIAVRFRVDRPEDADLLDYLRSQVKSDAEIPGLIKRILLHHMDND